MFPPNSNEDEHTEESPLLPNTRPSVQRSEPSFIAQTHSPRTIILILLFAIFTVEIGSALTVMPAMRIFEDIICHRFFENVKGGGHIGLSDNIDEMVCKDEDAVQKELAIVAGGLELTSAIPAIFFAFPYGLLADRIGRKKTFGLAILGIILSSAWIVMIIWWWKIFPLRLIWLGPIFRAVGGGDSVAAAAIYAIAADVTTEANRSNTFLLLTCGGLTASMIGPTIAAFLMQRSPWIPLLLGLVVIILGVLLIMFVPETLHLRVRTGVVEPVNPPEIDPINIETPSTNEETSFRSQVKDQVRNAYRNVYESTEALHSAPVILLSLAFGLHKVTGLAMDVVLRYISKRFHWKLSDVSFLLSMRAFINLILLLLILPGLSNLLLRIHLTSRGKDLLIARVSIVLLAGGGLIIAASPTIGLTISGLIIFTLGMGFFAICRSLVTSCVDQQHVARLYAALAVIEACGSFAAAPLFAALYNVGLNWKGAWIGLPFYGLTIMCGFAAIGVYLVRLSPAKDGVDEVDTDRMIIPEPNTAHQGTMNSVPERGLV